MKNMRHISPLLFLIGSVMVISSCNQKEKKQQQEEQQQKNIALKMDRLELTLDSIESADRSALIKGNFSESDKIELLKDSLTKEYCNATLQLKGPWYKGRGFPYEPILDELTTLGYNLSDYDNSRRGYDSGYKRNLRIRVPDWNMEDVTKIKNAIMKSLPFNPEEDKYSALKWTASKYDLELWKTGGNAICIQFFTK